MDANNPDLDALIYYAVDKASPYALAQHVETATLSKILNLTLHQLSIVDQGVALMWQWINAYSWKYGANAVPPEPASKAKTVNDVVTLVYSTIGKQG